MKYPSQSPLWQLEYQKNSSSMDPNGNSRELARFRQPFILTLFPDELIIEEQRVIWLKNRGPLMSEIDTIMATDIACVYASSGPFFGHVHVKSLTGGPEITVDKLPRSAVFKARNLIEGVALSFREGLKIHLGTAEDRRESLFRAGQIQGTLT